MSEDDTFRKLRQSPFMDVFKAMKTVAYYDIDFYGSAELGVLEVHGWTPSEYNEAINKHNLALIIEDID